MSADVNDRSNLNPKTIQDLQVCLYDWQNYNFGSDQDVENALMGMCEEAGELCHAQLKLEQGIRGTPEELNAKARDAVGDICIYMLNYLSGLDIEVPTIPKESVEASVINSARMAVFSVFNNVSNVAVLHTKYTMIHKEQITSRIESLIDSVVLLCGIKGWERDFSEMFRLISEYQEYVSELRSDLTPLITSVGKRIPMLSLKASDIVIEDIAEGLSNDCRYSGQHGFYSVAEHAVLVSELAELMSSGDLDVIRAAFLHDASEAYLKDIVSPLKVLCPGYLIIEEYFQEIISEAFNLKYDFNHPVVKSCDNEAYLIERAFLMPNLYEYSIEFKPHWSEINDIVKCLNPKDAKELFLKKAKYLGI